MKEKPQYFHIRILELLTLSLILLLCNGCMLRSAEIPEEVIKVLDSAGSNRKELLKVINYFQKKNEDKKLQAAYFLISNMRYYYYTEGKGKENYQKNFDELASIVKSGNGIYNHSWDSLQKAFPETTTQNRQIEDIKALKANILIHHINNAFRAWNHKWAKNLSFNDFCEYILPYKLLDEKPEEWMNSVQQRYKFKVNEWKNEDNPITICKLINKDLKQFFYINARFGCSWDVGYTDLMKTRTGRCAHATQLTAYTMRALGLPVVMDFTPHWANKNFSHQWNALLVNGRPYHFVGSESDPGNDKIVFTRSYWIRRKRAKIFRHTYSVQEESLALQVKNVDSIPLEFRSPYIKDVTDEYLAVKNVNLKLNGRIKDADFAYICVFCDQKWQPIFWSKIGWFNQVTFRKMETGVVYMPAYYSKGELVPAGPPFLLKSDGDLESMQPSEVVESVVIKKKYPEEKSNDIIPGESYELFFWKNKWNTLGMKKANADSLIYSNIPKGALLMVRNINKGKQERIFTYKEGKQQWW